MEPNARRSTALMPEQEATGVAFCRYTLLPLDDCLYALCKRRRKNGPLKRPDGPAVAVPKWTALQSSERFGVLPDFRLEEARGGCIPWNCMSAFDGPVTSRG